MRVVKVAVLPGPVVVNRDGTDRRYLLDPFERSHEGHAAVKPGDVLVAVTDTTPGGSTLVQAPCGCSALLRPN